MKKIYSKPDIIFEAFSLSTSIASGCDSIVGSPSKDACGITSADGTILFSTSVSACNFKWDELYGVDDYNGFCYHNPTDSNNLFNS